MMTIFQQVYFIIAQMQKKSEEMSNFNILG